MILGFDPATLALWAAALLTASVVAGFVAGLLGVGGGIVTVPVLQTLLLAMKLPPDLAIQVAVGTSLMTIFPTGIVSARSHYKRGGIDMDLLKLWAPLALAGTITAVIIARFVDGLFLQAVFAVVGFVVAIDMIVRRDGGKLADGFPSPLLRGACGYVIGLISTMMGIGGGTLSVPILSAVGYPMRRAVGTASALGPVIAIPGAIGFIVNGLGAEGLPPFSLGYVNLLAFALLLPAGMLLPPVGARVAHAIPQRALKLAFAAFLLLTAGKMAWGLVAHW